MKSFLILCDNAQGRYYSAIADSVMSLLRILVLENSQKYQSFEVNSQ